MNGGGIEINRVLGYCFCRDEITKATLIWVSASGEATNKDDSHTILAYFRPS
jgi:hypothetical protein